LAEEQTVEAIVLKVRLTELGRSSRLARSGRPDWCIVQGEINQAIRIPVWFLRLREEKGPSAKAGTERGSRKGLNWSAIQR